jgi:hypothetical protein
MSRHQESPEHQRRVHDMEVRAPRSECSTRPKHVAVSSRSGVSSRAMTKLTFVVILFLVVVEAGCTVHGRLYNLTTGEVTL